MKIQDDTDSRISAKNRLIKKNKCISCCLFVFGCASKTAVKADPVPPTPKVIYLEDEEGNGVYPPHNQDGPPTARFEEGIGFDDKYTPGGGNRSFSKNHDMSLDKLN